MIPPPPARFDDFVVMHGAGLLRTARLITLDDGDAEDLVQECLLRLARHWRRVGEMDQPASYARRVLVNLAMRGSKKRSRERAELGNDLDEGFDSAIDDLFGVREELLAALRQLTPRQRTMLALRYFQDLPESQVAEALGCTVGTVRSTTSRSLAQLRELIQPTPQK
jgi:RNA polymerase sigma-70 factor (sigma-E family)